MTNHDAFSQQENEEEEVEELEEETVTDANALLDKVFTLEENSPTPAWTDPVLMPDDELNSMVKSANYKQRELFHIVQS